MVAAENDDLGGVADLEGKEQANDLAALAASVHVVAHEQIASVLGNDVVLLLGLILVAHFLEHVQQVLILPMNVSKNLDGCLELHQGLFVLKALLNFFDKELNHLVGELDKRDALRVLVSV